MVKYSPRFLDLLDREIQEKIKQAKDVKEKEWYTLLRKYFKRRRSA